MTDPFGAFVEGAFGLWQNEVASDEATFARNHSAAQAEGTRNWQQMMSNTSYQRSTDDMKRAGLNPMLAYSQGGASTPSGAMGQSPHATPARATTGLGPTTAAQIRNLDADTKQKEAQADNIKEATPTHAVSRDTLRQALAESAMRIEKIIAETSREDASAAQIRQQTINLKETIPQIRATVDNLRAATGHTSTLNAEVKQRVAAQLPKLERELKALELNYKQMESPSRETTHAFESSATGAALRTIKEALKDLIPAFGIILPSGKPKPSTGSTTTSSTIHEPLTKSGRRSSTTHSTRTNN